MNLTDVVAFRRKADKYSRFEETEQPGFRMYTKDELHRVEVVDAELTLQLNRAFRCRTRYLVTKAYQYDDTRYDPTYHIVYHLSSSKEYMYVTRMVLENERHLLAMFRAYSLKKGLYCTNDPDRFPEDASMITNMHKTTKKLLLENPQYRLLHVTGVVS